MATSGLGQLSELAEVLEAHGVRAWADTGTALGLARQGSVLYDPTKDDIDLSIWAGDDGALERAGRSLEDLGYSQERWYWRGLLFKRKFFRPARSGSVQEYTVDFKLYRRSGDDSWTPLVYHRRARTRPFWLAVRALRERLLAGSPDRHLGRWPLGAVIGVHTFVVPARFGENLERWEGTQLWVPADLEGLLTLHYGNWKEPVHPWNSVLQDGAVRLGVPSRVLGRSVESLDGVTGERS